MKRQAWILPLLLGVAEARANPVAPASAFGFNTGWTVVAGLGLEFAVVFGLLRMHLADRREFVFRFLGVHVATLPICFVASAMEWLVPWLLAQAAVVFIEAWFYSKAPGRPRWSIVLRASLVANASSAVFAIITRSL